MIANETKMDGSEMKSEDIVHSLGYPIGMALRGIELAVEASIADLGLDIQQVQVLACVVLAPAAVQNEIAATIGMDAVTMVRVATRMESGGWITRDVDANDRRKKRIKPTQKAKNLWPELVRRGNAVEEKALAGISLKDVEAMMRALNKIAANLASK